MGLLASSYSITHMQRCVFSLCFGVYAYIDCHNCHMPENLSTTIGTINSRPAQALKKMSLLDLINVNAMYFCLV